MRKKINKILSKNRFISRFYYFYILGLYNNLILKRYYRFKRGRKIREIYKNIIKYSPNLSFKIVTTIFTFAFICCQILIVSAFEAHIINITANIINGNPNVDPGSNFYCDDEEALITITTEFSDAEIIFTLDGTDPECGINGTLYDDPFYLSESKTLKTRSCYDSKQSEIITEVYEFSWEYCPCECGDGVLDPGEECDDGNNIDGDGCSAECTIECVIRVCTQTMGGWGQDCKKYNKNNPGCMRENFWESVIGGTLIVGNSYIIALSDSTSTENYLPAGGTPSVLTKNHTDPGSTESGVLGGQVVALKLNVLFSDAGVGLVGPVNSTPLGELIIDKDKFTGMNVYDFLNLSELVLGGNTTMLAGYGATISDVNDTATKINENFVDCKEDNDYLMKSGCECTKVNNINIELFNLMGSFVVPAFEPEPEPEDSPKEPKNKNNTEQNENQQEESEATTTPETESTVDLGPEQNESEATSTPEQEPPAIPEEDAGDGGTSTPEQTEEEATTTPEQVDSGENNN